MSSSLKSNFPHGIEATPFELKVTLHRQGQTVVSTASGSARAQVERSELVVEHSVDGQSKSISRPLEIDHHAWNGASIEDRARLLESYVRDLIRDSGWLDVAAGSKVD